MIDLRSANLAAAAVIEALRLQPHPEGGYYRETWRDQPGGGGRGAGTAILFLLAAGTRSHWHRVDASELWIWQAGASLALDRSASGSGADTVRLGPDLAAGEQLQALVRPGCWQAARSHGAWTLVTCVVAPAFSFSGFELAPPDWSPTAFA
ncbi:MAG: cupin domain-containing protein [Acetobacteraceae bacterium]|nr:cupin domain-containing protein [Acetobacteraceae bacterium]